MSYFTTQRLIHKIGRKKVIDGLKALQAGVKEKDLAEQWGYSRARMSELCKKVYRKEWGFSQGAKDALEFDLDADAEEAQEIRKLIGPPSHLRIIKSDSDAG